MSESVSLRSRLWRSYVNSNLAGRAFSRKITRSEVWYSNMWLSVPVACLPDCIRPKDFKISLIPSLLMYPFLLWHLWLMLTKNKIGMIPILKTNSKQETCSPRFFNQAMRSAQAILITCWTSRYENTVSILRCLSFKLSQPMRPSGEQHYCSVATIAIFLLLTFSLWQSSHFRSNSMTCLKRWPRSVMKTSSRGSPPHGMAFWVQVFNVFASTMLPLYFKETKCKSFLRQIHIYGLHRIGKGRDRGAYFQSRVSWGVIANSRG